jgi:hypothetical protein
MTVAAQAQGGRRLDATITAIREGSRTHAMLYVFAVLVLILAAWESIHLGLPFDFKMVMIFSLPVLLILQIMVVLALAAEIYRLWRVNYQGSLFPALGRKIMDDFLAPSRVANALHAFLFMTIYMVGYNFMKRAIPLMHPFSWDETFMHWDRLVHFGRHPFEWLQPVFGYPAITALLNVNYHLWFVAMFACWFWQGFARENSHLRLQFLFGYTLTWFLGTVVLGTIFSSAGPCFYGHLVSGPDPYQPLMAYLAEANRIFPIWSLQTQDMLWNNYETGVGAINGISAMPSMHIGTSVLFVLLGFASGKRAVGIILSVFLALIFLGSILLGWHYAIDAYAGAAVALFGWWIAGRLVTWDRSRQGLVAA